MQTSAAKKLLERQNSQIERVARISYQDFVHGFVIPRMPVIMEGAFDHWAAKNWTASKLRDRLADQVVTYRSEKGPVQGTFGPLVDRVISAAQSEIYLRNIDIRKNLPQLIPDITPNISYAQIDWRTTRLLPKDWLIQAALIELFIGGKGTQFPVLHVDYWGMDGLMSQIQGEKEVILFAPDQSVYLYQNIHNPLLSDVNNVLNPDLSRYPLFEKAQATQVILEPGDTLYNPNGWWHTTRTEDLSVTVIQAVWNRANWSTLISELWRTKNDRSALQTHFTAQYLNALRPWLALREKLQERRLK